MTYAEKESSAFEAFPREIYTFRRGTNVWRYTSADVDLDVAGVIFTAIPMSRGNIEQTLEMARSSLKVNISRDAPFCSQFRGSPPTNVIDLTLQRFHDGLAEYITIWLGRVTNVVFHENDAELNCEPVYTSLKRPVLRMRYQTGCPHVLYGGSCGVQRSSYAVTGALIGATGTTLQSSMFAAKPDKYFAGGYVDWDSGTDIQRRFILSHTGSSITINLPFAGIQGTATVTAYPGCDHLLLTCNDKFNNVDNYGGQPFYPGKNPYNGTSIF